MIGGRDFFVRGVLEIPVHGLEEAFGFGIWSTLSRKNFEVCLDGFDDGDYPDWGPWPGYFAHELDSFGETLNQPCWLQRRIDRQRLFVTIADEHHPLALAQREGITAERVPELYAFYGHAAA